MDVMSKISPDDFCIRFESLLKQFREFLGSQKTSSFEVLIEINRLASKLEERKQSLSFKSCR